MIRGKSYRAAATDIAEGYLTVNPILLKSLDVEAIKSLIQEIIKVGAEIRAGKFPHADIEAIRMRNMRLQRLHSAGMVIKNFAKERKIMII